ncbi:MAG: type II toxin-antitoxin system HicA family toxin [Candidatus Aminicenantes bacterium]|nr:MAG: type II toxin-antitoxin system HicA family toxin [Candidatus Aminicenantes bacterium]
MKYSEITRKLRKLGCEEIPRRGKGSHRKWVNNEAGRGTIIPYHASKDLKTKTVKAIVSQLGLDWQEFRNI